MNHQDQMLALKRLCPAAELWEEGSQPLVFLPDMTIESVSQRYQVNLLLCPRARDSYSTRLFFSKQLPVSRNWSAATVLAASWYVFSWQGIEANMPWIEILATHLEAVK